MIISSILVAFGNPVLRYLGGGRPAKGIFGEPADDLHALHCVSPFHQGMPINHALERLQQ